MNCSCNASSYCEDDEMIGFSDRKLKAAKDHICPECKAIIKKGSEFIFSSVFRVNGIHNFKMCTDCWELTKVFFIDGWVIGGILDDLAEYFDYSWSEDLPSDCISSLSPRNKDLVCDMLQRFQEK